MLITLKNLKKLIIESSSEDRDQEKQHEKTSGNVPEGFAGFVGDDGGQRFLIVYDAKAAEAAFEKFSKTKRDLTLSDGWIQTYFIPKVLKAMLVLSRPRTGGNCWGAWEINYTAAYPKGTGLGGQIYKSAYAISDSGWIVPDRKEVSGSESKDPGRGTAAFGWKDKTRFEDKTKEALKGGIQSVPKGATKIKLDDLPPNNKTPTEEDDCRLHKSDIRKVPKKIPKFDNNIVDKSKLTSRAKDYLNWAYSSEDPSVSESTLNKLVNKHREVKDFYDPELVRKLESLLIDGDILQAFFNLAKSS